MTTLAATIGEPGADCSILFMCLIKAARPPTTAPPFEIILSK
eukprot:CAMPEP_0117575582 /NCGR_PEP_ID=MMETSP0784-20121206/62283_1 /TAXON_ID=39447 /ORGANISM="" /LENGTH=41 /DNA_ID= /DNA_START= /DNA_END= /DNA_ORIENTATION=